MRQALDRMRSQGSMKPSIMIQRLSIHTTTCLGLLLLLIPTTPFINSNHSVEEGGTLLSLSVKRFDTTIS